MPNLFKISNIEAIAAHLADAVDEARYADEMVNDEEYAPDYGEEYADLAEELDEFYERLTRLQGEIEDFIDSVVELRERHPDR